MTERNEHIKPLRGLDFDTERHVVASEALLLVDRVEALENGTVASPEAAASTNELKAAVETLTSAVASLEERVVELETAPQPAQTVETSNLGDDE